MLKTSLSSDISQLEHKLLHKTYKLSEVSSRLEKVAFDIVRFKDDDDRANLWQIQSCEDGDFIVAKYNDTEEVSKTASIKTWEVMMSKVSNTLDIFYKGEQIAKVSAKSLGMKPEDLPLIKGYLPKKLASNKNLVKALLSDLPKSTKNAVLTKYPELF